MDKNIAFMAAVVYSTNRRNRLGILVDLEIGIMACPTFCGMTILIVQVEKLVRKRETSQHMK